jgi:hypothetical protein
MVFLGRSLLLLLLVVDWAGDPSMGRSRIPAMDSRDVIPRAIVFRRQIDKQLSESRDASAVVLCSPSEEAFGPPVHQHPVSYFPPDHTDLIYLFMSLLR